jgi:hypothetical protein
MAPTLARGYSYIRLSRQAICASSNPWRRCIPCFPRFYFWKYFPPSTPSISDTQEGQEGSTFLDQIKHNVSTRRAELRLWAVILASILRCLERPHINVALERLFPVPGNRRQYPFAIMYTFSRLGSPNCPAMLSTSTHNRFVGPQVLSSIRAPR